MITIKFGGIIFDKIIDLSNIINILNHYENKNIFLVISAFGKTSQLLKNAINHSLSGELNKSLNIINDLKTFYYDKLNKNKINNKEYFNKIEYYFDKLENLMRGVYLTSECSDKTWANILSYGEIISSKIIYLFLLENYTKEILWIDATKFMVTNHAFINAEPEINKTKLKFEKLLGDNLLEGNIPKIIISQGFIGANDDEETTTMGFESSNLSACLIGYITKSEKILFVSDVEGVRTCDPKYFKFDKLIKKLNYKNSKLLGVLGVKLLYPSMIEFIEKYSLEIEFHSYNNFKENYTIVYDTKMQKDYKLDNLIIIVKESKGEIILYNASFNNLSDIIADSYFQKTIDNISYQAETIIILLSFPIDLNLVCNKLENIIN